jgi:hypothetical protein
MVQEPRESSETPEIWEIWRFPLWIASIAAAARWERYFKRAGALVAALVSRQRLRLLLREGPSALSHAVPSVALLPSQR